MAAKAQVLKPVASIENTFCIPRLIFCQNEIFFFCLASLILSVMSLMQISDSCIMLDCEPSAVEYSLTNFPISMIDIGTSTWPPCASATWSTLIIPCTYFFRRSHSVSTVSDILCAFPLRLNIASLNSDLRTLGFGGSKLCNIRFWMLYSHQIDIHLSSSSAHLSKSTLTHFKFRRGPRTSFGFKSLGFKMTVSIALALGLVAQNGFTERDPI